MSKSYRPYDGIERRYKHVRGEKKFRLPSKERSRAIEEANPQLRNRDVVDNNPGLTPPAPNPDEL